MISLLSAMMMLSTFSVLLITSTPRVAAAGPVDPTYSKVIAVNSPQDIGDPISVHVIVKNETNVSITDVPLEDFSFEYIGNAEETLSADGFNNYENGTYNWDITDVAVEGPVTVRITVSSVTITQTAALTWNVGDADGDSSGIIAENSPQTAGSPITLTVTLKDEYGNDITDAAEGDFLFTYDGNRGPTLSESGFVNQGTGDYTWMITNIVAEGPVRVTVTAQTITISQTVDLTWVVGTVDADVSDVVAVNSPQIAGEPISITVTLKDAYENVITNAIAGDFEFAYLGNAGPTITEGDFFNHNDGTYTWKITDTVIEGPVIVTVTAKTVEITQTASLEWVELILPTAAITTPQNNRYYRTLSTINGTATNMGLGIDRVNITIQNASTEKYWNGAAWKSSKQWLITTLSYHPMITWTYNSGTIGWSNKGSYYVNATAVDNATHVGVSVSSRFFYDSEAPTVAIALNNSRKYYTEGENIRIFVNFTEDESGIKESSIFVNISTNGVGLYVITPSNFLVKTDNTHWYYNLVVPSGHDGKMNISVRAKDNVSQSLSGMTWNNAKTFDTIAPSVTIGYNKSASYFRSGNRLKVYANFSEGNSGMDESTIRINISTQGDDSVDWTTMARTSNTRWTYSWILPAGSENDGLITVHINASDNATNILVGGASAVKFIDNTAPIGNITQYGYYNASFVNITGTANDAGSGLSRVTITIYNMTNGSYWDGVVWRVLPHHFVVNGSASWYFSNGLLFPFFTNGTIYRLNLIANDSIGNSNTTADSNTFVYDTWAPRIVDVSAEDITESSATITWETSENATSIVQYGPTPSYGSWSNSSAYMTAHSRSLGSLSSSSTYHYRVISIDRAGNHVNSTDANFTTGSGGGGGPGPGGDTGGTSPDSGNLAPVAQAGGPYSGYVNQSIVFSGSGSTDDKAVVGYRWDWNNDKTYDTDWFTAAIATHIFTTPGIYTVNLQVKDEGGLTNSDSATVSVNIFSAQHQVPVAEANGPYSGFTYQHIYFDGSGSQAINSTIVNFTWSFGDGMQGYVQSPVHSYDSAGSFLVTLIVKDSSNFQGIDTTMVTITLDANRNNISDIMEETIGKTLTPSDIKPVQLNNIVYDLVDTDSNGVYDVLYNPIENTKSTLGQKNGKQLIDVNGDGQWDFMYNPALGATTPYVQEPLINGFTGIIIILFTIVLVIIVFTVWLYKTGRL